jgi:NAD(P)-dependent dehydrogenase (short-subunit alcohol dehydrogenase family)
VRGGEPRDTDEDEDENERSHIPTELAEEKKEIPMKRFEGKVALLTGAASGIGRATAERLAGEGARALCSDVQQEAVEATAGKIREAGGEAEARVCDVGDPEQISETVQACIERFGRLDILCNIAGILRFDHTHEIALDDWHRVLAVNLTGTFLMCQAAIPHLLETKGNIVNTASTSSLAGLAYGATYGASKGGVLAFTRTVAVEYGKQGLRANAVCPGSISTPMTQAPALPEGLDATLLRRAMPLDQFRGPEVVANIIAFLASDEAIHINGEHIRVDGATLS